MPAPPATASDTDAGPGKRRADVQRMFAAISGRYDLLNRVLSGSLDRRWRLRTVDLLATAPGERVLDVCTGTADLALALAGRGARVVAADFTLEMLAAARPKLAARRHTIALAGADALRLPFASGSFDAITAGFGIRNFENLESGLAELHRVLVPGGRAAFLEFSTPTWPPFRVLYHLYLRLLVPALGALLSRRGSAYRYLAETVRRFPDQAGLASLLERGGWHEVRWVSLAGGIVAVHLARAGAAR